MLKDEFKERYTTIPFAIYQAYCEKNVKEVITHYHREIELIAMTEGSAEFYVNSQAYPVSKWDILIVPPYALHRGRMAQDTKTSYDCICFDLQLLCDESLKKELGILVMLSSMVMEVRLAHPENAPYPSSRFGTNIWTLFIV